MRVAGVLLVALALSGCFSEILPGPTTRLAFACAVLDRESAPRILLESWVAPDVDLPVVAIEEDLMAELRLLVEPGNEVAREERRMDEPPADWTPASVRKWLASEAILRLNTVRFHVVWAPELPDDATNQAVLPGVVVLSVQAIRDGAARLDRSEGEVARAVLLHAAGHALGAVNQGIPVQDPDLQVREGPPGHDPDPTSVMHAGWDSPATMRWAANATYDRYPDAVRADWAAAVAPGGVCAA
jgi:hypothetical protein